MEGHQQAEAEGKLRFHSRLTLTAQALLLLAGLNSIYLLASRHPGFEIKILYYCTLYSTLQ